MNTRRATSAGYRTPRRGAKTAGPCGAGWKRRRVYHDAFIRSSIFLGTSKEIIQDQHVIAELESVFKDLRLWALSNVRQAIFRLSATETVAESVDNVHLHPVIIWRQAGFNRKSHRSEVVAILPYLVPSSLPSETILTCPCNRSPAVSPNQGVELYVAVDPESTNQMSSDYNLFLLCLRMRRTPAFVLSWPG